MNIGDTVRRKMGPGSNPSPPAGNIGTVVSGPDSAGEYLVDFGVGHGSYYFGPAMPGWPLSDLEVMAAAMVPPLPPPPIAYKVGDRVVRLAIRINPHANISAGQLGTVKGAGTNVFVEWDNGRKGTYTAGENLDVIGLASGNVAVKPRSPDRCDTCKEPNAWFAPANQQNGSFRCGQCRALKGVFA